MRMGKSVLLIASMALAVLLACGVALAAAGDLDPTFGSDGRVQTEIGERAVVRDLVALPDGKLVAAGDMSTVRDLRGALVRYNPGGSLDRSFGGDGKVTTDFAATTGSRGAEAGGRALLLQPDGKLVAAGFADLGNGGREFHDSDFALARYEPDGALDRSFGTGGKETTAFTHSSDSVWALVRQRDGKLVAAGGSYDYSLGPRGIGKFALARYLP
jgi:uncharacterized delta-60 repeat protein